MRGNQPDSMTWNRVDKDLPAAAVCLPTRSSMTTRSIVLHGLVGHSVAAHLMLSEHLGGTVARHRRYAPL
jgi:hypothetical protein